MIGAGRFRLARPFPITLALRYLRSTRRDAFVSFLSLVATGGLALGVAALVLSLAALAGFHDVLLSEVRRRTPDVLVEFAATPPAELRRAVEQVDGVAAAQWLAETRGWVVSYGRVRAVTIVGYQRRPPYGFGAGTSGASGVLIGSRLAAVWGIRPGEIVEIASARPTLTPLGPQPRTVRLPVGGLFETGRTEEGDRLAVPLADAAALFGGERSLEVDVTAATGAAAVARRLTPVLPAGAEARTWKEQNRALLFALRLEKSLMFVSVSLIVLVAALALIADLALIVSSKRPEIGMLRAMGASRPQLRRAFLALGGLLGSGGAVAGAVTGCVAAWILDRWQLLRLSGQVYFIDHVPFRVRPVELLVVVLLAAVLTALGSAVIARRAATLDPVEALRR